MMQGQPGSKSTTGTQQDRQKSFVPFNVTPSEFSNLIYRRIIIISALRALQESQVFINPASSHSAAFFSLSLIFAALFYEHTIFMISI